MTASPVSRIGDYIREQRESSRLSLRRLAEESGISNPYLSQIERGLRKPSAEILQQIAKALRISAEQLYVQAGLLDEREASSLAVEAAVLGDPLLNERQKRVLLDIYASFLKEVTGDVAEVAKDLTAAVAAERNATGTKSGAATKARQPGRGTKAPRTGTTTKRPKAGKAGTARKESATRPAAEH